MKLLIYYYFQYTEIVYFQYTIIFSIDYYYFFYYYFIYYKDNRFIRFTLFDYMTGRDD